MEIIQKNSEMKNNNNTEHMRVKDIPFIENYLALALCIVGVADVDSTLGEDYTIEDVKTLPRRHITSGEALKLMGLDVKEFRKKSNKLQYKGAVCMSKKTMNEKIEEMVRGHYSEKYEFIRVISVYKDVTLSSGYTVRNAIKKAEVKCKRCGSILVINSKPLLAGTAPCYCDNDKIEEQAEKYAKILYTSLRNLARKTDSGMLVGEELFEYIRSSCEYDRCDLSRSSMFTDLVIDHVIDLYERWNVIKCSVCGKWYPVTMMHSSREVCRAGKCIKEQKRRSKK